MKPATIPDFPSDATRIEWLYSSNVVLLLIYTLECAARAFVERGLYVPWHLLRMESCRSWACFVLLNLWDLLGRIPAQFIMAPNRCQVGASKRDVFW
jgi:hypothetical protein